MTQFGAYTSLVKLYVLVLFFLLLLLCGAAASAGEYITAPMCGEVKGFADEHNHHIQVGVLKSPAKGEAIVLIVRAFPVDVGEPSQQWIQLRTNHSVRGGLTVSSLSNTDGVLLVENVEPGTNIDIHVSRLRNDTPLPFRFWSYYANSPLCHIDISTTTPFIAPVPAFIDNVATPAKMYFKSVVPQGMKAFTVDIVGGPNMTTLATSFQVMSSAALATGAAHSSKEVVAWDGDVVYFVVAPPISAGNSLLLRVSIAWVNNVIAVADAAGKQQQAEETHSKVTEEKKSSKESPANDKKKFSVMGVIFVLFLLFIAFIVIMSFVNYRFGGITEFPEMIPFIDFFRSCGQYASVVKERFYSGKGYRGGYSDLGRHEVSTANI